MAQVNHRPDTCRKTHTCGLYEAEVSNCMSLTCPRDECVDNLCFGDVASKEVHVELWQKLSIFCSVKRAAHHFPSLSPCLVCTYQRSSSFMPIKSVCSEWDKYQMKYQQSVLFLPCQVQMCLVKKSHVIMSRFSVTSAPCCSPSTTGPLATGLQYTLSNNKSKYLSYQRHKTEKNFRFGMVF